jgi:aspartyl-tRNA synthetase
MDRFFLEEKIMQTSNFADQLNNLAEFITKQNINSENMDVVLNVIIGVAESINIHTNVMYESMCKTLKLNQYHERGDYGFPIEFENSYNQQ